MSGKRLSTPGHALCKTFLRPVRLTLAPPRNDSTHQNTDFYLTHPPLGAVHKPVHPSKIVLAGDSAGAALCLTVLTILRDLGIPQPAGAVLISPWVDLTHSFPSVITNSATVEDFPSCSLPHLTQASLQ